MSEPLCSHSRPSPVGYVEGPVQRADAAVAGLVLHTTVHICPDCDELVVAVHLRPKTAGAAPVLTMPGFTALAPVAAQRQVSGNGRGGCVVAEPTRPGEISDSVSLGELLARAQAHAGALFDHECGIAPLTDAGRAGHALGQLVYTAALTERAPFGRWVYAAEALSAGATHTRVAAAMGLDPEELHAGLRSWARGQLRHGLIDDTRHAEVLALLGEARS